MKRAVKVVLVLIVLLYTAAFAGVILTPQSAGLDTGVPASYAVGGYGQALEEEANADPNTVMYCDWDPCPGKACDTVAALRTNMKTYSDDLSNAGWIASPGNATKSAADVGAGAGGRDAYTLTAASTSAAALYTDLATSPPAGAGVYTMSVDLLAGTTTFSTLQLYARGPNAYLNTLSARIVSGPGTLSAASATDTLVSNLSAVVWTRVALTYTNPSYASLCPVFNIDTPAVTVVSNSIKISSGVVVEGQAFVGNPAHGTYCGPTTTTPIACSIAQTVETPKRLPRCALSGHRHKGIGPFTDANYLQHDESTFRYAGDFLTCQIIDPDTLPGAGVTGVLFSSTDSGSSGYDVAIQPDGSVMFTTYGAGPSSTVAQTAAGAVVAGRKSLVCWGREGDVQSVAVNGVVTTKAGAKTVVSYEITMVGRSSGTAGQGFNGRIYEMLTAPGASSAVNLTAMWAAASTCRTAGRCLPTLTGETHYLGDSYLTGAPGTYWCSATSCASPPALATTGQLLVVEGRYTWPTLAWTQIGTVPRAAGSVVTPRGYGAPRWWLGGFAGTNELVYDAPFDASAFIGCMDLARVRASRTSGDAGTTRDTLWTNTAGVEGWWVDVSSVQEVVFHWFDLGGVERTASSLLRDEVTNDRRVCFGHDGSSGWIAVTGSTPVSAAGTFDPWNAGTMVIGGANATVVYPGEIAEVALTTALPTAAYLTQLVNEPCTAGGGACIPRDASTAMSCVARDYDLGAKVWRCAVNTIGGTWSNGGTLTKTSRQDGLLMGYKDADGAGPFSVANKGFQLGTGSDVLDFTGTYAMCLALNLSGVATDHEPLRNGSGAANIDGYEVDDNGTAIAAYFACAGEAKSTSNAYSSPSAMHIYCFGFDGGKFVAKLDNGTLASSAACAAPVPATGVIAWIGSFGGSYPSEPVYALWASTSTPSDALFTKIQRRFMGARGDREQPVTTVRAGAQRLNNAKFVPANAPRVEPARRRVQVPAGLGASSVADLVPVTVPAGRLIVGITENDRVTDATYAESTFADVDWTANNAVAPDGTMTAWSAREKTAAVQTHAGSVYAWNDARAAQAFYVRPVGDRVLRLVTTDSNNAIVFSMDIGGPRPKAYTTGLFIPAGFVSAGYEEQENGWFRVFWDSLKGVNATNYVIIHVQILDPNRGDTFLGQANSGFDYWGYTASTGAGTNTSFTISPFSDYGGADFAADVVTIPNPLRPNGSDWTNLILQSEAFTSTWVQTNSGAAAQTVTVNNAIAPDLSFTADTIVMPAVVGAADYSFTYQGVAGTAVPYVASVYASSAAGGTFNVMLATAGSATCSYASCVVPAGNVPVRCSVTRTLTAAAWFYLIGSDRRCAGVPASDAGTFAIWGAQVETGTTPSPYCPTTTAARTCGPGGATGKVVTNMLTKNETMNIAPWTKEGGVTVGDLSASCPVGLDGKRMSLVTVPGNVGVYSCLAGGGNTVPVVTTVDLALPTGDAACTMTLDDGCGSASRVSKTLGAVPERFNSPIRSTNAGGVYGVYFWKQVADTCTRWCIARPQVELGASAATGGGPYCGPTGATAKTCAPKQSFCVRVKDATPLNGALWTDWSTAEPRELWSFGGAANYAASFIANGSVYLDTKDAAGAQRYASVAIPGAVTTSTPNTLIQCEVDGTLIICVNGACSTPAATGTGTAVLSAFASSMHVGSLSGTSFFFNGTIGSISFNVTGDPKDFPND